LIPFGTALLKETNFLSKLQWNISSSLQSSEHCLSKFKDKILSYLRCLKRL
jgi:hypothetical protein